MSRWYELFRIAFLLTWTLVVWYSVRSLGWVNWDDPDYVLNNPWLDQPASVWQIYYMGNYHPITLLSLALDAMLWQKQAIGWHTTQWILHAFNVVLLYILCRKIKLDVIPSFSVAILWSVLPVHAEPVAWVSSRKDLLYTFFGLSSLIVFATSLSNKNWNKPLYLISLLLFLFACLSKAMAVTIPIWMLLLFYKAQILNPFRSRVIQSLLPFFLLSLVLGFIAWQAQADASAIQAGLGQPLQFLLAGMSMVTLVYHVLVPLNLSPFYPYPNTEGILVAGLFAWCFIGIMIFVFIKYRKQLEGLGIGLMLFLIGILPVSQLIPVGIALTADRYAYFASAGLLIGLVPFLWEQMTQRKIFLGLVGFMVSLYLVQIQKIIPVWQSGLSLFTRVTTLYPQAAFAWSNLGTAQAEQGDHQGAENSYRRCIAADSTYWVGYQNLSTLLYEKKQLSEAFVINQLALLKNPDYKPAQLLRFRLSCQPACKNEDLKSLIQWISENPGEDGAWALLGEHYRDLHQYVSARTCFGVAFALKPGFENYQISLAMMMAETDEVGGADAMMSGLLQKQADDVVLLANSAWVKYRKSDFVSASVLNRKAIAIAPRAAVLHANQVIYEWKQNRLSEAREHYRIFLELGPDSSLISQSGKDFREAGIITGDLK